MATDDVLERFRLERRILASLEHPNLARLIDGGATEDGQPYFVMEYGEGVPITQFCDAKALSIEGRLALFMSVCEAVHHAHQSLVVHRDIKPSNILVTPDGVPKLLDFGIGKVLDPSGGGGAEQTAMTRRVLTPEYAAPEQLRGDVITTATDVHGLGLLLYELLTGRHPFVHVATTPAERRRLPAPWSRARAGPGAKTPRPRRARSPGSAARPLAD
jgi:serine/threonine-protein kinase